MGAKKNGNSFNGIAVLASVPAILAIVIGASLLLLQHPGPAEPSIVSSSSQTSGNTTLPSTFYDYSLVPSTYTPVGPRPPQGDTLQPAELARKAPAVATDDITSITTSGTTLNANLTSMGSAASIRISFQWGTSPGDYSRETPERIATSPGIYSFPLTGLTPGATYYFRARAVGDGTTYGAEGKVMPWTKPPRGKIAFMSDRDGNAEIYVMNADGSNQVRLTNNSSADTDPAWSPDSKKIAFTSDRDGNDEIYVMNANGTVLTRLTHDPGTDKEPSWSPDGSKIAFTSDRGGTFEVYAMKNDGSSPKRLTSTGGTNQIGRASCRERV